MVGMTLQEALMICIDRNLVTNRQSSWFRFLKNCKRDSTVYRERRSAPRTSFAVEVVAVPIDSDLRPIDRPFVGLTRDISVSGVCLLLARPVNAPYLIIRMENDDQQSVQLILRVVRSDWSGEFYEVAGEFVFDADVN